MIGRKVRNTPLINQLLLILMGAVILYMAVSFVRQIGVSRQRQVKLDKLTQSIGVAQEERVRWENYLEYVRSEPAIEARGRRLGWVRQDQELIVPVGGGAEPSPGEQESVGDRTDPTSPRNAWWDMFFGTH
jgi:hypothetical protein